MTGHRRQGYGRPYGQGDDSEAGTGSTQQLGAFGPRQQAGQGSGGYSNEDYGPRNFDSPNPYGGGGGRQRSDGTATDGSGIERTQAGGWRGSSGYGSETGSLGTHYGMEQGIDSRQWGPSRPSGRGDTGRGSGPQGGFGPNPGYGSQQSFGGPGSPQFGQDWNSARPQGFSGGYGGGYGAQGGSQGSYGGSDEDGGQPGRTRGPENYPSASGYGSGISTGYESRYGTSGGYGQPGPTSPTGRHSGRGPKGYQRSDDRIREDIGERLTAHPDVDPSEVEFDVQQGVVTLRGTVDERRAKRMIEDALENIPGVKDVHNQLRVEAKGRETERPTAGRSEGTGTTDGKS